MRETAASHARTLKALAQTPDPTAWVEEAATRATVEAEIAAWLRREADEMRPRGDQHRVWSLARRLEAGEHRPRSIATPED
jgi:hypothetical protein